MLNTSKEERTFSWIKRECIVASGLYEKVIEDLEPEDEELKEIIPDPITYVRECEYYKNWWDEYKESKCEEFREKHADTISELEKKKDENFKKLQMTEEEKLEYFLEQEEVIKKKRERGESLFFEPPKEYYDDQKAIRGFFNSRMAVYLDLMSKILEILNTKEFDYISIDESAKSDYKFEERLTNFLEPFENKYYYDKHCEECKDCDDLRNAEDVTKGAIKEEKINLEQ